MNDEELRDALRGLPRVGATDGFTQRVLRKGQAAEASAAKRPISPSLWIYAAAALVLAAGLTLATLNRQPPEVDGRRAEMPGRVEPALPEGPLPETVLHEAGLSEMGSAGTVSVEELRREYAALQRELQSLRRVAAPPAPVVYLGGNDKVDLVLDVGRLGAPGLWRPPAAGGFSTGDPGSGESDIRPASFR